MKHFYIFRILFLSMHFYTDILIIYKVTSQPQSSLYIFYSDNILIFYLTTGCV